MKEKRKIYSELPNGEKKEYDVILTFKNEDNQKDYVIYTDNERDEENKLKIYASIYNADTLEYIGIPEDNKEWEQINKLLDQVIMPE